MNTKPSEPVELIYEYRNMWLMWSILFIGVSGWSIAIHQSWVDIVCQIAIGIASFMLYAVAKHAVLTYATEDKEKYINPNFLRFYGAGQYVYVIKDLDVTGYCKIGYTNDLVRRVSEFGVKLPFTIGIVCVISTDNMRKLERELHTRYAGKRVNGEWFNLDDSDLEYLRGLTQ